MDCLWKLQIPRSTDSTIVIRPQGKCFVTGVASSYEIKYDENRLKDYITINDYAYVMHQINETIHRYWPCQFAIWFGYLLAPFTLGLSFMAPNLCIKDAKDGLKNCIEKNNRIRLKDKGLKMSYR